MVRDNTVIMVASKASPLQLLINRLPSLPKYDWDHNDFFCPAGEKKPFALVDDNMFAIDVNEWQLPNLLTERLAQRLAQLDGTQASCGVPTPDWTMSVISRANFYTHAALRF